MKVSENTSISMPIRNMLAIVTAVAIGVWAYFGVIERLNQLETADILFQEDLLKKAEQEPKNLDCLLYTSPSPRDGLLSRMPSSA